VGRTGKVRNIAEFGAFYRDRRWIRWTGARQRCELDGTASQNPHEVFKKGEDVTAKVLKIDRRTAACSLGIQTGERYLGATGFKQHKVGQIVRGKVSAYRYIRRIR